MRDNILIGYVVMDVLFVTTGALLIIFALMTQAEMSKDLTAENVVHDLLLAMCPLNGMLLPQYLQINQGLAILTMQ